MKRGSIVFLIIILSICNYTRAGIQQTGSVHQHITREAFKLHEMSTSGRLTAANSFIGNFVISSSSNLFFQKLKYQNSNYPINHVHNYFLQDKNDLPSKTKRHLKISKVCKEFIVGEIDTLSYSNIDVGDNCFNVYGSWENSRSEITQNISKGANEIHYADDSGIALEVGNLNSNSSVDKKYTVSFGTNYSDFSTTDGVGKLGICIGFYKNKDLNRFFTLQYGLSYNNKKVSLINKKIKSDDFTGGLTLYTRDIINNYHYTGINGILRYYIIRKEFFSLNALIGFGYAINFNGTEMKNKSVSYSDTPFLEYDYRYANEPYTPLFPKSGFGFRSGIGIEIIKYSFDIFYTYHPYKIERATEMLLFGEKLYSISFMFGLCI